MKYTTVAALAERLGISRQAVHARLATGDRNQLPRWKHDARSRRYWTEADVINWERDFGIEQTRRPAGRPKGTSNVNRD